MTCRKSHEKDGSTFRPLRGLRGVRFGIKDGHFTVDFRLASEEASMKYVRREGEGDADVDVDVHMRT